VIKRLFTDLLPDVPASLFIVRHAAAGTAQDAMGTAHAERWMDGISDMAKSRPLTTVAIAVVVACTLRALIPWRRG
jgi:hypothetical protein